MSPGGPRPGATKGGHAMYSEFNSPLLCQVLLGAILTIFALGMVFWLLLAYRTARSIVRKCFTLERDVLAKATKNAERALSRQACVP